MSALVAGAPSNLTVESITSSSVSVTWEEPAQVNGILREYRVRVLTGSDLASSGIVPGNVTRFEATSLQPFTDYRLEVTAVNGVGPGEIAVTNTTTSEAGKCGCGQY